MGNELSKKFVLNYSVSRLNEIQNPENVNSLMFQLGSQNRYQKMYLTQSKNAIETRASRREPSRREHQDASIASLQGILTAHNNCA